MTPNLFTVRGIWPFPLDMLRHDDACAATPADQDMIDRLSRDHAPDRAAFKPVEIALIAPRRQNTARWESFGWSVPSDREHELIKADRARTARRRELLASAKDKLTAEEWAAIQWGFARDGH